MLPQIVLKSDVFDFDIVFFIIAETAGTEGPPCCFLVIFLKIRVCILE